MVRVKRSISTFRNTYTNATQSSPARSLSRHVLPLGRHVFAVISVSMPSSQPCLHVIPSPASSELSTESFPRLSREVIYKRDAGLFCYASDIPYTTLWLSKNYTMSFLQALVVLNRIHAATLMLSKNYTSLFCKY